MKDIKKFTKWIPVIVTGIIAMAQAVEEKQTEERIDKMDERITNLEKKGEA